MIFGLGRNARRAKLDKPKIKIDIDVIKDDKVNNALESMNAPFYRVCTKAKKGYSWRRLSTSCNPDYINAYAANEDDVSRWLRNIYDIKLKDFLGNPESFAKKHDKKPKHKRDENPREQKESIDEIFDRLEERLKGSIYE